METGQQASARAERRSVSGYARLAWAHSLASAGDALVTVSLAGSLFFSVSPDASRRQVLLYLVIAMAPFSLVAPLIGPTIDRFNRGHRILAVIFYSGRAAAALALAFFLDDLAFYFIALVILLLNKASGIVKQALIPGLVEDPAKFVSANSRLARLATIAATVGGATGTGLLAIADPAVTLITGCVVFLLAAGAAFKIPPPQPSQPTTGVGEIEYRELHTPGIVATSNAFIALRASVGFFVFGLAFALRRESEPAWVYGAAVAVYGIGVFVGNMVSPVIRRRFDEERLMGMALGVLGICTGFGALGPTRSTVIFVSLVLGASAAMGRQAFDSLVQHRAPLAMRGRVFARFETLFQVGWVAGGAVATGLAVSVRVSMAVVLVILAPVAVLYVRSMLNEERFAPAAAPDPLATARQHLAAASGWLSHNAPAQAAVELAAGVDLLRLSDVPIDGDMVTAANELRDLAVHDGGSPPDPERVTETLSHLDALLGPP